jgi:hypothetical protein
MILPREKRQIVEEIDFLTAQEQIEQIISGRSEVKQELSNEFPQLFQIVSEHPELVIVYSLVAEARYWPGLYPADEEFILNKAEAGQFNSALRYLSWFVHQAISQEMRKKGLDPEKENRKMWNARNQITSALFSDIPLAQRLGKEREYILQKLGQKQKSGCEWYETEILYEEYQDWKISGKWPFPKERAPEYSYQ